MYSYLADDATTTTTPDPNAVATPATVQAAPPMRGPRWYPRNYDRQWGPRYRQTLNQPTQSGQPQQNTNAPQYYDAQMHAAAQQQQINAQQAQAAPAQAATAASSWTSYLPQAGIALGVALIVAMMTSKK